MEVGDKAHFLKWKRYKGERSFEIGVNYTLYALCFLHKGVKHVQNCSSHCRRSDVFIIMFEHISHLPLMFLLLTLKCLLDRYSLGRR